MASHPLVLLRPPRLDRAVRRGRLIEPTDGRRAVVVVGPAGAGKTVTALQIAEHRGGRLLWVRSAPGWRGAADLVAMAAASVGVETPPRADDDTLALAGDLLELLETEPSVLVVDDHHEADGVSCDPLLGEVIPLLPESGTIVLTTRRRPAGLLGRVPAGAVCVLDGPDLAFTADEAAGLFAASGRTADDIERWVADTSGWAAALALAAEADAGQPGDLRGMLDQLLLARLDDAGRRTVTALAAVPYLTATVAAALGLSIDPGTVAARTSLVTETSGHWRMHDVARDALLAGVPADEVAAMRSAAATALVDSDPPAAIELHLSAGDAEAAADVLGRHLSDVSVDQAMAWLYRMPAELRRRFPPVLTAGRATVDLDLASAEAARRAEAAATPDERAEALLALGSARAGAGDLPAALDALEALVAQPDAGPRRATAMAWLGMVRWWAGDAAGAGAALGEAGGSVWAWWARGMVALADGDARTADHCADAAQAAAAEDPTTTSAPSGQLRTASALLAGDVDAAERHAVGAADAGGVAGGFDLACGATALAWVRAAQGRADEALTVCDLVERRVGRHDHHSRLQAALVRRALSATTGDREERERAERRVRDLRRAGYAPVEALAERLLPGLSSKPVGAGLRVELLGDGRVLVDGVDRRDGFRSRKALDILRFVALAGERGVRREQAIEAVWPGRPADKGRTLLRTALSEIRRVLEPDRAPGDPSRFLDSHGERLVVRASVDLTDIRRTAGESPAAAFDALLVGPSIDSDAEWAGEVVREVDALRLEVADRVSTDDSTPADARIRALEAVIAAEPWRKDAYDRLAGLHRAAGDDASALAVERRWFDS